MARYQIGHLYPKRLALAPAGTADSLSVRQPRPWHADACRAAGSPVSRLSQGVRITPLSTQALYLVLTHPLGYPPVHCWTLISHHGLFLLVEQVVGLGARVVSNPCGMEQPRSVTEDYGREHSWIIDRSAVIIDRSLSQRALTSAGSSS